MPAGQKVYLIYVRWSESLCDRYVLHTSVDLEETIGYENRLTLELQCSRNNVFLNEKVYVIVL